mgnify:CR=1 FL=1
MADLYYMAINNPQVAVKPAGEWNTASTSGWGFGFPRSADSGGNKTRPGIPANGGLIRFGKCRANRFYCADDEMNPRQPFIDQSGWNGLLHKFPDAALSHLSDGFHGDKPGGSHCCAYEPLGWPSCRWQRHRPVRQSAVAIPKTRDFCWHDGAPDKFGNLW